MKKLIFISVVIAVFSSCKNGSWSFDDYEYTTVYFAYQTPVRTIVLGEDIYDTTLDNEHRCQIMATMGGAYSNGQNITVGITVDDSLCDDLYFEDSGNPVLPMPSNYYSLSSTSRITIPKGSIMGPLDVQLTDAFFADPLAMSNNYVIPLLMTSVDKADSILSGRPILDLDDPDRVVAEDWNVKPKDFILYAVKYINPYDANYLRRGRDVITNTNGDASLDNTVVRRQKYVEDDQVVNMSTRSLSSVELPLSTTIDGNNVNYSIVLDFDASGNCTVSGSTPGVYSASGSGKFVEKGEKKSWANKDRNAVYLDYEVHFSDRVYHSVDTLVVRDRGLSMETFGYVKR